MRKVNKLLTYALILDFLTAAYLQFMIILTALQDVLSQELVYVYQD
jgi:hypothetical protein